MKTMLALLLMFVGCVLASTSAIALDEDEVEAAINKVFDPSTDNESKLKTIEETLPRLELSDPEQQTVWALLQVTAGDLYFTSRQGKRAQNLERSIAAYEAALSSLTSDDMPEYWLKAKYGLGKAFRDRANGDLADLERAIAAYEDALTVAAHESSGFGEPTRADVQLEIAELFSVRTSGAFSDNIDRAIQAYELALQDLSPDSNPEQWAVAQGNLGVAYQDRAHGTPSENIERAIVAHEASLRVFTRAQYPTSWAKAQLNLGVAYLARSRGDRATNIERGIGAFNEGLFVFQKATSPRDWAKIKQNLGLAYMYRVKGNESDNIEKSIEEYSLALEVFQEISDQANAASVQNSLGNAYNRRHAGERSYNIDKAITLFEASLEFNTRGRAEQTWAALKHNLANAYLDRSSGVPKDNLEKALSALQESLAVFTRDAHPSDYILAKENIAEALDKLGRIDQTEDVDSEAIGALEDLIGDGLDPTNLREILAQRGQVFTNSAWRAVKRKDVDRALELVKMGRARGLEISLGIDRRSEALAPDKRRLLDGLRTQLRETDRARDFQPDTANGRVQAEALAAESRKLRDAIRQLLPKPVDQQRPQDAIPANGAIVVPLFVDDGGVLLLETAAGTKAFLVPGLNNAAMRKLVRGPQGWNAAYRQGRSGAQREAAARLLTDTAARAQEIAEARELRRQWLAAFDGLAANLWTILGEPLVSALEEAGVAREARIIVLPQGQLSLLPFWLARDPESGESLFDRYEISLSFNLARPDKTASEAFDGQFAAWFNPTDDLPFTKAESLMVPASFQASERRNLTDDEVTNPQRMLDALDGWSIWHLSTHGEFNWRDVGQAGLMIRGNDSNGKPLRLTVSDIKVAKLRRPPNLVALSACETGLADVALDQFVGLPEALIGLGVQGVVSSLWAVSDDSTTLLMAKFYELNRKQGLSASKALRSAQLWLQRATALELSIYVQEYMRTVDREAAQQRLAPLLGRLRDFGSDVRPYKHPFYWAAFVFYGHDTEG
ncbi:CHAT domain-containing protein [Mesorhizobium sp.]|uniref:CHAT domain-containing tetratricopeptide repeat protein n=1 Tax=Mesorhizobium sp. TaxID=1871066 RepID=UPI000FE8A2F0|nr:CHAT domain-containing protein [Mesorhizobium sp.]RWO49224.1 MAG: CHAT domain-containing protein [Mesorhizobium sp.]